MKFFSGLASSIFFRIYAGLVLVCALVAFFAYVLINSINAQRAAAYREDMASGAFYLVASGIARQQDAFARQNWLADASSLFDANFTVAPYDRDNFDSGDAEKLEKYKAVVRYDDSPPAAEILQKIPDENNLLKVALNKVTEQQAKAMGVFLLDDLSYYPGQEQARIDELRQYFSYDISLKNIQDMGLDPDQEARIRRKEIVLLFRDSTSVGNSAITMVIPNTSYEQVIVMGPVPLFDWSPFRLVAGVTLLSLLLISLGVYTLIFPLERKIRFIQAGVTRVRAGELDAKVEVAGEDEIAHLATTFNSMTEHIKRLIDTQRELTRAVSHELRTPVARIRFAVDMLADTDGRNDRMSQLDVIDADIEALDALIDEILTYAKLEEGSPKLDMESVDLQELAEQVVRETNALGKPLEVSVGNIKDKSAAIADRRYLHRVVQNLAGNATRYAKQKIIIGAGVNRRQMAYVTVEDDGDGIPEADREKIFLPFARLDDSRTRASGGYGLGLSIVARIAFWFGGRMEVDTSPSLGGARFTMYWPVKPMTDNPVVSKAIKKIEKLEEKQSKKNA